MVHNWPAAARPEVSTACRRLNGSKPARRGKVATSAHACGMSGGGAMARIDADELAGS